MQAYVGARGAQAVPRESEPVREEEDEARAKKREPAGKEELLRMERRAVRQRRRHEDQAWRQMREQRKDKLKARKQKKQSRTQRHAQEQQWRSRRKVRRDQLRVRKEEGRLWREQRNQIRRHKQTLPIVSAWIAVPVIVDSATRRCFGLPLFSGGPHVTAQMVVDQLKALLPCELHYLIAHRGVHFGKLLEQPAGERQFTRVYLAPHRPRSNGIAERFVRTLQEWLLDRHWSSPEELDTFLSVFLSEYNDRPH